MDGKTVLITGSTDGVGRYVATKLAVAGAKVLIHGRDKTRASTLSDEIKRAGGSEPAFYQADLSSLAEARKLADAVLADHKRIDVFVSNAGIGSQNEGPARQTSKDGYELRFAVNYLSGFLLARLLLPLLKASAPSRIVNVASLGQHPIDFDDVMITKNYSGSRAYAQSKLSQIMFTIDLAEELKGSGVTVNSLLPGGATNTGMVPRDIAPGRLLDPNIVVPPLLWLVSESAGQVTGGRFVANLWDTSLPPDEAAEKARGVAGWMVPAR